MNQYPTEMARQIFEEIYPKWKLQFLEKNAGYGEYDGDLGDRGEFVEIWRKAKKLRRGIWDEEDIGPEPIEEVAMDMIGHLFLLLGVRERQRPMPQVKFTEFAKDLEGLKK